MKKTLVIMAVLMSVGLATSVYAQIWNLKQTAEAMATGRQPFKYEGVLQSVDPIAQTATVKIGERTYTGRLGLAKYEGGYSGINDLKIGDMVKGTGMVISTENWVSTVAPAGGAAAPGGMAPSK